jgi:hypothetical protein
VAALYLMLVESVETGRCHGLPRGGSGGARVVPPTRALPAECADSAAKATAGTMLDGCPIAGPQTRFLRTRSHVALHPSVDFTLRTACDVTHFPRVAVL